ncbi:hypothetical protein ACN27G_14280 [Plantactinospora sp. WMMB334]|uniref:hypothetical protein n=1 Tax=Plantactinospora sp. WMMB334 TaxID=3404119 RepID=UPI003B95E0A3
MVLLDAPVAGTRGPAEERRLVVLASGPEQARERIGRDEYAAQYPLSLALKDVNLALYEVDIDRFGVASSLAAQWQRAVEHGLGDEDLTVLARAL